MFALPSPARAVPTPLSHPRSRSPSFASWSYAVPADVCDAFDYYDANRSGYLDYLELQTALQAYAFDATVEAFIEHAIGPRANTSAIMACSPARNGCDWGAVGVQTAGSR